MRTGATTAQKLSFDRKVLVCLAGMLMSFFCLSQTPDLQIDGTVKEGRIKLAGAKVLLKSGSEIVDQVTTNESGKFVFVLPLDKVYTVLFSKSGYVTKRISVDTRGISHDEAKNGFGFGGWEVLLFKEIPGLDVSILNKPIGKIKYEPKIGTFDYDREYTASIHHELDRLNKELAEREATYQKAISSGDAALRNGNFEEAINAYDKALLIKPAESYPKTKKEEARKKLSEQKLRDASLAVYRELVAKADAAFEASRFADAKTLYQQASEKQPSESYPKKQMAECDKKLKSIADEAERENAYKEAIAAGDKAFAAKDYGNARSAYQKATGIKPKESYPKDQIEAIGELLAEQAALAEKEKSYKSAILAADKSFAAKSYVQAKEFYLKALKIKPGENYPKEKIVEIDRITKELADQAAREKEYKATIEKADKLFASKALDESLTAYEQASEIKPEAGYPKEKIEEVKRLIQKQKEQAEKESSYGEALVRADAAFHNGAFADAKTAYGEALKIKPGESYPKEQVALCDQRMKALKEQAAREKEYADYLTAADKYFAAREYEDARSQYKSALAVKPDEKYPTDQIAKIDKIIAEQEAAAMAQKEKDAAYQKLIASADASTNNKDYQAALRDYNKASAVKPDERYPKDRINELNKLLGEQAAARRKEEDYKSSIREGDDALASEQLNKALLAYRKAAQIKPEEDYPPIQIKKVKKLIDEQASANKLEKDYQSTLSAADAAFKAKKYDVAVTNYKKASGIKPKESYPKDQIAEIEAIRSAERAEKERDSAYSEAIKRADESFAAKDYETARSTYLEAQNLKPMEAYPQQQIARIDSMLNEALAAEEKTKAYLLAIKQGDGAFGAGKFKDARPFYQKAASLKPEESYPKQQLEEIDRRLLALDEASRENAEKLAQYKEVLAKADFLFQTLKYAEAKHQYETAGGIMPEQQYPRDQLARIEKLMKASEVSDIDARYRKVIKEADQLFGNEKFREALKPYQEALSIKEADPYAKRQLDRIETILQRQAYIEKQEKAREELLARKEREAREAQARNNVENNIKEVDEQNGREEFVNQLAQNYPQGVTEETYQEGNKTIVKRIVVKENHGDEYRKVTHTWGGVFYFKNDRPISEFIWLRETGN